MELLYLCGRFAVGEQTQTLSPMPETIGFDDLCRQGFPHYTGRITYRIPVPGGKYRIMPGMLSAACLRVGKHISAFMPLGFEEVESNGEIRLTVCLGRRNLFGPLHELPKNHGNYWAGSFRTEGEHFSDACQVNPQGLLEPPKIILLSPKNP